jgi:hypothetical protein
MRGERETERARERAREREENRHAGEAPAQHVPSGGVECRWHASAKALTKRL